MKRKISVAACVGMLLLLCACGCKHEWMAATCTVPKTCSLCDEVEGQALGHEWMAATCTVPKTCSLCEEVEGQALGHDWKAATYEDPETCRRCSEEGAPPLSSISISTLETELKGSGVKFAVEENSDGFSFEYVDDNFLGSVITYTGSADKKQNVIDVTIAYSNISNDIITNKDKMSTAVADLLKDPRSVTIAELKAASCFIDLLALHSALGAENVDTNAILDIICENKTVEINGWFISVETSGSTVTITMNK